MGAMSKQMPIMACDNCGGACDEGQIGLCDECLDAKAHPVTHAVRERKGDYLSQVEALEDSHGALAAQLEAFVELANDWFTGGMPEDWRGRCVCANAALGAARKT